MLRSTRSITYTPPPSRADARALIEIAAIDARGSAGPADVQPGDDARRAELVKSLAPIEQTRITLGTLSAYQFGRYQANRRQVGAWMEIELSKPASEAIETPEGQRLFSMGIGWARTAAALERVETRKISRLDGDGAAWKEISPPAFWSSPGEYLQETPADLADALADAADEINPGLFYVAAGEDAKKNGGISVE